MGRAHRLGNIITILGCKFFFAPKDIKIFLTEKNDFFKTERHVDTNFLVNVSVTKRRARCLESSNKSSGQRCAYMTPRIGKFSNFRAKFRYHKAVPTVANYEQRFEKLVVIARS